MRVRVSLSPKFAYLRWCGNDLNFNYSGSSNDGFFFLSHSICRPKGSNFLALDTKFTFSKTLSENASMNSS